MKNKSVKHKKPPCALNSVDTALNTRGFIIKKKNPYALRKISTKFLEHKG